MGGAYGGQKTHAPRPVPDPVARLFAKAGASTFLYGWPCGPAVSVLAAELNVGREMSGARSGCPGGREGAHPRGGPGGGPRAGR